MKNKFKGKD